MYLSNIPLSKKVIPPSNPKLAGNHDYSSVFLHPFSIAAILGHAKGGDQVDPIQPENGKGAKLENTKGIDQGAQIIQGLLTGTVPVSTTETVFLGMGKIYENQCKQLELQKIMPTGVFNQSQNLAIPSPIAAFPQHHGHDNLKDIQITQEPTQENALKRSTVDSVPKRCSQMYPRMFRGDHTILNLPLVENGTLHCGNLKKRIRYELSTRGISYTQFAEKILGRSKQTLLLLLRTEQKLEDLQTEQMQRHCWNLMFWISASDSDKAAMLNGEAPSDPNLKLFVSPTLQKKTMFTIEQRLEVKALCQGGRFPNPKKRQEIAAKWNVNFEAITNLANRIKKQQKPKKQ